MSITWSPDDHDANCVDDLTARNVSVLRIERMSESRYWLMFEIDGKQHNLELEVGRNRRARVFNSGDLPTEAP